MVLSNIKSIGRYQHIDGRCCNLKTGQNKQRGTTHIFYLNKRKRIFITDKEFYDQDWTKID